MPISLTTLASETTYKGPQGSDGGAGFQGSTGLSGPASSIVGPQGSVGSQGSSGPQGPQGADGEGGAGTPGPQGNVGADGDNGPQGSVGADGLANTTSGSIGAQGAQGAANTSTGPEGFNGPQGPAGSSSTPGLNTQVFFNDSGSANGSADLLFFKANNTLSVPSLIKDTSTQFGISSGGTSATLGNIATARSLLGMTSGVKVNFFSTPTANSSHSISSDTQFALVIAVGAGGGGGGVRSSDANSAAAGGGGGGGGCAIRAYNKSELGNIVYYTIGTGGAGGVGTGGNGDDGSNTSFRPTGTGAIIINAAGGSLGLGGNTITSLDQRLGGIWGEGSNGHINIRGTYGGRGVSSMVSSTPFTGIAVGGAGGGSFLTKYGTGTIFLKGSDTRSLGNLSGRFGAGGGGGASINLVSANSAGGAGGNGAIIIIEFLNTNASS